MRLIDAAKPEDMYMLEIGNTLTLTQRHVQEIYKCISKDKPKLQDNFILMSRTGENYCLTCKAILLRPGGELCVACKDAERMNRDFKLR